MPNGEIAHAITLDWAWQRKGDSDPRASALATDALAAGVYAYADAAAMGAVLGAQRLCGDVERGDFAAKVEVPRLGAAEVAGRSAGQSAGRDEFDHRGDAGDGAD